MASSSSSSTTQAHCACAVNVANFVSTKLRRDKNSNNYISWKEQMLCLMESQDLLGFIDGKVPPPPEKATDDGKSDNQDYIVWKRTDRLLKGWILGALSDEVVQSVVNFDTARDVWLELEKTNGSAPPPPAAEQAMKRPMPSNEQVEISSDDSSSSDADNDVSKSQQLNDEPAIELSSEGKDWHEYLPLYRAALRGEWNTAKAILDQDTDAIKARVAFTLETALHIAVGTGKAISFVAKLVDLMSDDLLKITDELGGNALHVAAQTGNTAAARILVSRLPDLLYVPNNGGRFPVHMAALLSQRDTLEFLISQTKDDMMPNPFAGDSGLFLLQFLIDADFFDMALHLVEKYPHLVRHHPSGEAALQRISCKEAAFPSGAHFNFWERLIYSIKIFLEKTMRQSCLALIEGVQLEMASEVQHATPQSSDIEDPTCSTLVLGEFQKCQRVVQKLHSILCKVIKRLVPRIKGIHDIKLMHQQALRLVKCLCKHMESLSYMEVSAIYTSAIVTAAHLGIHEVIEVIVETFPAAIYSFDGPTKQYIFHLAVKNRCEKVFNLIYQTSDHKHLHSDLTDSSSNTILHSAASLAPPHKLNLVSGAALQMQREIQWFKEVEKFVAPRCRGWTNGAGKTAKMVFTEEHKDLKVEGEKWMKDTANSCTIAAALIATVVFAAAITVPGGNESDTGYPMFSKSAAFTIFAVSDAVSLFTSTTSLLMFLSILTSRYAEEDFLYALPKRLCIGLVSLFVSILFMMAAFSSTLYLVFGRKNAWVLTPVAALACLPITSFVLLQFPLLVDVISSTYGRGIFGKQSDHPFY